MEAKTLPIASLDDIVFEGRNKAYGAYVLRQQYPNRILKATGMAILLSLFFISVCYTDTLLKRKSADKILPTTIEHPITLLPAPYIPKPLPAKLNAPELIPATTGATKSFKTFKIVTDQVPVTELVPSQPDLSLAEPGLTTTAGELPGTVGTEVIAGTAGHEVATEQSEPFVFVEQMPEFPGGLAALYKFINKHLHYPTGTQAQGLEGNVVLTFVVSASGEISDIQVLQDIGGGAGEEAIRVIRKMPNWRPGVQNQRAVPVRFTLPIRFKMQ